jgi:competence protein ComEA
MMFERQIKGIISVSVILAFIPFISFFYPFQTIDSKCPSFSTSRPDSIIVEIVAGHDTSGIYFVEPGTTAKQLLSGLDSERIRTDDIELQNTMKISLVAEGDHQRMTVEKMTAVKRLALGLPIDINLANRDELIMLPGVGNNLAESIVAWRDKIGRIEKLEQLMAVKGIKEKKLSKLRQYLYVE